MDAAGHGAHVLIVDDDAALLGRVQGPLGEDGYRLTARAVPPADVAEVASLAPDAIVLGFPFDGTRRSWDFLVALKGQPATAAVPVLICTADGQFPEEAANRLAAWDCEVLPEPFDVDAVRAGLARCLKKSAAGRRPLPVPYDGHAGGDSHALLGGTQLGDGASPHRATVMPIARPDSAVSDGIAGAGTLGQAIRQRRAELGLTQEQLAARIGGGVRQSDVSRLEADRVTLPRRQRLERIAAALGLPPGELLVRAGWPGADGASGPATPPIPAGQAVPLERYGEVLAEYLRTRGERQLFEGSLLSNQFVEAGVGPDEIIALHVEALDQALKGMSFRQQAQAIGDSHQFLLDVMIAYGLKYREYFELKKQESERAAEARDELLATVAHELRNPLAAATTSLDFAMRSLQRGNVERLPPLIGSAKEALARLSRLTANLVRASQGQVLPLIREPVDLVPLLTEACDWIRPAADEKGIALAVAAGTPVLWVLGDTDALLTIAGNLLSNAVRYTPAGGRVEIAWGTADGTAWMEVRDTGIGMTPEVQERVFDKFFRAREARTVEAQGLGLGLTLVRDLVSAHEGRVDVQSAAGRGSSFRVTLPLAGPDDRPDGPSERRTNGRNGHTRSSNGAE